MRRGMDSSHTPQTTPPHPQLRYRLSASLERKGRCLELRETLPRKAMRYFVGWTCPIEHIGNNVTPQPFPGSCDRGRRRRRARQSCSRISRSIRCSPHDTPFAILARRQGSQWAKVALARKMAVGLHPFGESAQYWTRARLTRPVRMTYYHRREEGEHSAKGRANSRRVGDIRRGP